MKCFVQQAGVFKPGSNCAAAGANPNTNVYNADCMEFLVESVYYDNFIEVNQSEISWHNYTMVATAGVIGLIITSKVNITKHIYLESQTYYYIWLF